MDSGCLHKKQERQMMQEIQQQPRTQKMQVQQMQMRQVWQMQMQVQQMQVRQEQQMQVGQDKKTEADRVTLMHYWRYWWWILLMTEFHTPTEEQK